MSLNYVEEGGVRPTAVATVEVSDDMVIAFSMRRTLYFITSIDLFFNILLIIIASYINIIAILLVLMGWYGAMNYRSCPIIGYMIYAVIYIIINIYLLITIKESAYIGYSILLVLQAILYIWIFEFSLKFYNLLEKISPENLNVLRNPQYIGQSVLILY